MGPAEQNLIHTESSGKKQFVSLEIIITLIQVINNAFDRLCSNLILSYNDHYSYDIATMQGGMVLIRTALTLNISRSDALDTATIANGTHLGFRSLSQQQTHVQTSHRPLQLVAAFSADRDQDSTQNNSSLNEKNEIQQLLGTWKAFSQLLIKRGSSELGLLLSQYHLSPKWLLCMDEQRLQAWLPQQFDLYHLRQGELRKLNPIPIRDSEYPSPFSQDMSFFSINLQTDDYFLLLPAVILTYFASGEITEILSGLRQLPIKMSELLNTARLRGMGSDYTWLAWQVLHREADQKLIDDRSAVQKMQAGLSMWMRNGLKKQKAPAEPDQSSSESLEETNEEISGKRQPTRTGAGRQTAVTNLKSYHFALIIGVPVVVLFLILLIMFWPFSNDTDETTNTTNDEQAATTLQPTTTPTPTLTPVPTPTPEPANIILAVAVNRLNMRAEPDRNAALLHTLDRGDALQQLAEPENDWVLVLNEDGIEGYVYFPYVESGESDPEQ